MVGVIRRVRAHIARVAAFDERGRRSQVTRRKWLTLSTTRSADLPPTIRPWPRRCELSEASHTRSGRSESSCAGRKTVCRKKGPRTRENQFAPRERSASLVAYRSAVSGVVDSATVENCNATRSEAGVWRVRRTASCRVRRRASGQRARIPTRRRTAESPMSNVRRHRTWKRTLK